MISSSDVRLLLQYVDSLEDASNQLAEMYADKNAEEVKKIKNFMLDIQSKIDDILKK